MSPDSTLGKKLKDQILNNDVMGTRKGYFYSFIKDGKNFINPKILPPETW